MADIEGKKLTELRVIDLKTELERRGLDKTGNKAALLERLSKAITDEGQDPDEYLIVPCGGICKIIPRKNSVTGTTNQEESTEVSESIKEEPVEVRETNETKIKIETKPNIEEDTMKVLKTEEPQSEVQNAVKKEIEDKQELKNHLNKSLTETIQVVEKKVESEASTAVNQIPTNSVSTVEANGIDNEDSINLTIGEDEENLLAEETESHDRHKDGGDKKKVEENKKGDTKGSSRGEAGANNKEGSTSGANVGTKNKQDGGGDGSKSAESGNKSQKRDDKDKKASQVSPVNASSRNLWVSGLSSSTRATDLKQIFSKYGKVIGAKVVTNARTPGARCYGYVTMSTSEDAAKCIQHLHRTELHGRVISVEKAKGDTQQSHMRKRDTTNGKSEKKEEKDKSKDSHEVNDRKDKETKKEAEDKGSEATKKSEEKSNEIAESKKSEIQDKKEDTISKDADSRSTKSTSKKPESERGRRDEKRIRSWDHHRSHTRSRSRERRRRDDVLTFAKIREERERQRLRERERMLREEERRRREDMERQREVERRQREEAARLEREREKLRRERERIEQEKAELLRLERERQKLEREKLERERLELKRQQMRLEESRRAPPPPSIKRSSSDRRDPRDMYVEPDRKRMATDHSRRHTPERVSDRRSEILDRVSDRRLDTSPPARYESSRSAQDLGLKKEFKRSSDFTSRSSRPESFSDVSRGREVIVRRDTLSTSTSSIDPRQVKGRQKQPSPQPRFRRYERPSTTTYTRERDVRRSDTETHRSSRDSHTRYSDSFKPTSSSTPRESRYVESNRTTSSWHSGPPSTKSFNSVTSSGTRDPRNEPSSWSSRSSENVNRWSNSGSMGNTLRHPVPPTYQSGPMQSMGLTAPGTTPSYDRFDPYKSSMQSMRKY
ncbi:SAFB-like transcription modulator isoform X1 [Osmia bicornis bicornis]|uniref:SAFB-like transcription modulator isoform X1 n=1 Tax=Osmia bicornis bicornis TaxID=1437191 RepID=UPI0010F66FCE|nr:SAFB-like transcription modulator isoform X1 [Osmia bicornis bicornis]